MKSWSTVFACAAVLVASLLAPPLWLAPAAAQTIGHSGGDAASTDCVEADVGGEHASTLGCLNRRLQRLVEQAHIAGAPKAPIDASSPSNVVGTANQAVAEEKMGDAFGKSATPQRPVMGFGNPLLQTGAR
jgi:hypothetical protein